MALLQDSFFCSQTCEAQSLSSGMVPGMSCWDSSEASLEIAPTHRGVSIPAIVWASSGPCQDPGSRAVPFYSSARAGLPWAETTAPHPLAIFTLPLSQVSKAGRCGKQLTTPRSIPASYVLHLSHHLSKTHSPEQQCCLVDGTRIKCSLVPELYWCREANCKRL